MRKRVANRRDKEQAEREVHVDSWPVPEQQGPSLGSRRQIVRGALKREVPMAGNAGAVFRAYQVP
jgi:hypothetical protein